MLTTDGLQASSSDIFRYDDMVMGKGAGGGECFILERILCFKIGGAWKM